MNLSSRTSWLPPAGAAALLLLGLASCERSLPSEPAELVQSPETDPTPASTATPAPAAPGQWTRGNASLHIRGIDRLRLNKRLDYVVAATLTWEMAGAEKRAPIVEVSLRGTRSRPCQSRPCGEDVGLVVRVTANPAYDGQQANESRHCGSGTNFHQRLALGPLGPDGGVDVALSWNEGGLHASTPVDSVDLPARVPGSFGFGRFLAGAPFAHGERGFGWDELSIQRHGGDVELRSISGVAGHRRTCP